MRCLIPFQQFPDLGDQNLQFSTTDLLTPIRPSANFANKAIPSQSYFPAEHKILMASIWHTWAAAGGATAVAAGAWGAHGFRPSDPYFIDVFDRANKYHFIHSLLLACAPIVRRPNVVGYLTLAGMVGFCGSCYAVAIKEDRNLGKLAPYG